MQAARRWDVHFHRTGQLKSKIQTNFKAKDSGSPRRTLPSWRSCNLPHRASERSSSLPLPIAVLVEMKSWLNLSYLFGSSRYFSSPLEVTVCWKMGVTSTASESRKASPNFHRETHALGSLAANERHRIRWCIQVVSGVGFNHHSHRVGDWCLRLVNFFRSILYTPFTHWLVKTWNTPKRITDVGMWTRAIRCFCVDRQVTKCPHQGCRYRQQPSRVRRIGCWRSPKSAKPHLKGQDSTSK